MGETTYESVGVSACERERERRGENRRLARQLNHVIENAYQTDSAPSVCLPPTHGHSTPIPCGSRPIRALVHCYSNHGARWGGSPCLHGNCICLQRVKEDRWSALSSPCQSDARLSENVCGFFCCFFFFIASSTRLKWRWAQQEAFSHWQLLVFLMELLIRELLRETITVTGCFLFGVFGSVSSEDCTGHRVLTYGINSTEHLFSCIYDKLEGKGYDWINKELICSSRYQNTHPADWCSLECTIKKKRFSIINQNGDFCFPNSGYY